MWRLNPKNHHKAKKLTLEQFREEFFEIKDITDKNHAYFIHSYEFVPSDEKKVSITTNYGKDVIAAVSSENIFGTQFHPEKSQNTGIKILTNFLNL